MAKKTKKIEIKGHANHVEALKAQRNTFKEACGVTKSKDGHDVANTTNANTRQLANWWHKEYWLAGNIWRSEPEQKAWQKHYERIMADTAEADPDELYKDNHWFWNTALLKLAIYLQSKKSRPSSMDLLLESFDETIGERIDDAASFIKGAGEMASDAISAVSKAADAVSDVGDAAWSGLRTVAIVGGGLVGAAIILPPVIRAIRD